VFVIYYSFTEVLQDTFLEFFDSDKLKFASATSIRFSPEGFDRFYDNWEKYKVNKWNGVILKSEKLKKKTMPLFCVWSLQSNRTDYC
jgi:hypothetical protein